MKARDLTGRRITRVNQHRFYNAHLKRWEVELLSIELDDGSRISLDAIETIEHPAVTAAHVKPKGKA